MTGRKEVKGSCRVRYRSSRSTGGVIVLDAGGVTLRCWTFVHAITCYTAQRGWLFAPHRSPQPRTSTLSFTATLTRQFVVVTVFLLPSPHPSRFEQTLSASRTGRTALGSFCCLCFSSLWFNLCSIVQTVDK